MIKHYARLQQWGEGPLVWCHGNQDQSCAEVIKGDAKDRELHQREQRLGSGRSWHLWGTERIPGSKGGECRHGGQACEKGNQNTKGVIYDNSYPGNCVVRGSSMALL